MTEEELKLKQEQEQKEAEEYVRSLEEHTPHTNVLDKDEQKAVIDIIKDADITPMEAEKEYPIVEGDEECPHCETVNHYSVPSNITTIICKGCDKVIPLCEKCGQYDKCDDCLTCEVANFRNVLKGNVTIEKFLENLEPPLTDMTSLTQDVFLDHPLCFEDYERDVYGGLVSWDEKFWSMYGLIRNCMLTIESKEEDVRQFVEMLIKKNRE